MPSNKEQLDALFNSIKDKATHAGGVADWHARKAITLAKEIEKELKEEVHCRNVESFYNKKLAVSQMLSMLSLWVKWPKQYCTVQAMHDFTKRFHHVEEKT